ncbi:MAG: ATP-binding protein, partial [Vicinamibacteria bacterium]
RALYFSPVTNVAEPDRPSDEDRKHARAAEDAARLAAIVAGAEDAIVSKTLEGIITSWNPAAESMFGYTAQEAVGQPITLVIPPDRMHEEHEILARLKRGERTEHFETIRVHKSGRMMPVSLTVSPVHDETGRVIGASKIARDRTEQQRAHESLRATVRGLEALYRLADRVGRAPDSAQVHEAALDAITSAMGVERASILLFDAEGVMRFVAWRGLSDTYRRATDGHSPWRPETAEHAPITVFDVFQDASLAPLRDAVLAEGIRALLFVPIESQGRLIGKFMVYADAPRAFGADECRLAETIGRHVAFGLARVDAERSATAALARERAARTEADAARAQAESTNREKDEFLAMLAHELRNPLGPILHAAEILGQQAGLEGAPRRAVGMIDRQARHMARLLEDLLDVARITRGRIGLRSERMDLREPVAQAVDAQRSSFEARKQVVSLALPDGPVPVLGDPARLQQVVGNLLHNARKYTPEGGAIRVSLLRSGSAAEVQVEDDGIGIATEHLPSIFDLFVQANPTLARTEGGLGIGLTLARGVVDLHGGRIVAASDGIGRGSRFTVTLPLMLADVRPAVAPAAVAGPPTRHILVVEDNEDGREALATLLRLSGHEVDEAATGREALLSAERNPPELVLLDIGLPDLDGYQVAAALRASLGDRVRLVALTGYGQPGDRERVRNAGFDAHLLKPVGLDAISRTVASLT